MGKKQKKVHVKEVNEEIKQEIKEELSEPAENNQILNDKVIQAEPESGDSLRNRKARLIVRNLSFKASEEQVRDVFSPYGNITNINILCKPDGRRVGCCFVEYTSTKSAAKALAHVSGKPVVDRPVVVDWAVPKTKYLEKNSKSKDSENPVPHDANDDDKSGVLNNLKNEEDEEDDDNDDEDDEASDGDDNESSSMKMGEEDSNNESDEEESRGGLERRKPLRESHDLSEGCTVFVKNIPFSVDNLQFKKCMQNFGPIYYALVCIDLLTEHSKGTGFVKFRTKEAAESCLTAGRDGEIILEDNVLETKPALSREDLKDGPKNKVESKKDSRNLFLIKEGVILAGTPAAAGVSQEDMVKRLQIEQWKTQMLRNLHKFVSRNRLIVQNLPPSYDDTKLRALFLKYGGTNPYIKEARVMRDFKDLDSTGKAKSKGFGFVSFAYHENALCALRALNNNPDIFSPAKRPIVAFSIEDKKALNLRQKRLERSRFGLQQSYANGVAPRASQNDWEKGRREEKMLQSHAKKQATADKNNGSKVNSNHPVAENLVSVKQGDKKLTRREKMKLKRDKFLEKKKDLADIKKQTTDNVKGPKTKFVGEKAKQGQIGLMSRKKLREQAELLQKPVKAKNTKSRKKQAETAKIKQPKQKQGKSKESAKGDNFSKLVNKYKNQLSTSETERKKWFE